MWFIEMTQWHGLELVPSIFTNACVKLKLQLVTDLHNVLSGTLYCLLFMLANCLSILTLLLPLSMLKLDLLDDTTNAFIWSITCIRTIFHFWAKDITDHLMMENINRIH